MADGGNGVLLLGFNAGSAIVKYSCVKFGANADAVIPVAAEGDLWLGVSQFAVSAAEITAGKGATVMLEGISLVKVGTGGVTFGTIVVTDGAGLAVASNTGGRPIGICMATGVAGDFVPVHLTPGLPVAP